MADRIIIPLPGIGTLESRITDSAPLLDLARIVREIAVRVIAIEQRSPSWDALPPKF